MSLSSKSSKNKYDVTKQSKEDNVTVFVSASSFCMVPSLFQKVDKLQWQWKKGYRFLNANPDAFEILLQYFMFSKLPETSKLTNRQTSDLLKMTKALENVSALVEHIKIYAEANHDKTKGPSSLLRKGLSSLTRSSIKKSKSNSSTKSNDAQSQPEEYEEARDDQTGSGGSSSRRSKHNKERESCLDISMDVFGALIHNGSATSFKKHYPTPVQTVDILPHLQASNSTSDSAEIDQTDSNLTDEEFSNHGNSGQPQRRQQPEATTKPMNPFDVYCNSDTSLRKNSTSMNPFDMFGPEILSTAKRDSRHQVTKEPEKEGKEMIWLKDPVRAAYKKIKDRQVSKVHAEWCSSQYIA